MTESELNVQLNTPPAGSGPKTLAVSPNEQVDSTKDHDNSHLVVPPFLRPRRTSLDSAFSGSDLSELSFGSISIGGTFQESSARFLRDGRPGSQRQVATSAWRRKFHEFWLLNYGAVLVLVSQVFGIGMNICTRMLETPGTHGEPMHPFQILFVRQSITATACTMYALWSKSIPHFPLGPPGTLRWLLIVRGLGGFMGVCGFYFSIIILPLSEATVLTYLGPILVCYVCSMLIPGEVFSGKQQIASFVSFTGVIFIAQPFSLLHSKGDAAKTVQTFNGTVADTSNTPEKAGSPLSTSSGRLLAVGLSMMGVVGSVFALTAIRIIGTRVHAFISVNYFSVWCTVVSLIALLVMPSVSFRLPGNLLEWTLLFLIGTCGFIMQGLLTVGLAYGGPSSKDMAPQDNGTDLEMQTHQADAEVVTNLATTATKPFEAQTKGSKGKRVWQASAPAPPSAVKGAGNRATSMIYTSILFSLLADRMIFGIVPGLWSWIGSSFILTGVVWVAAEGQSSKSRSEENSSAQSKVERDHQDSQPAEQVGLLADTEEDAEWPPDSEDKSP